MATIRRKKLVKGVKVQAQPIDVFFETISDEVNTPAINKENLPYRSNFDLTFNTRILKNRAFDNPLTGDGYIPYSYFDVSDPAWIGLSGDGGSPADFAIDYSTGNKIQTDQENNLYQHFHFILPNTQEVFEDSGLTSESYTYTLNSLTLSLEQLDNPAGLYFDPNSSAEQGTDLSLAATDAYSVKVSLHRKNPYRKTNEIFWQEEIGSWTFPSALFLNGSLAQNPFTFDNLKLKVLPDSVYLLSITSNNTHTTLDLGSLNKPWITTINNLQVSLNFNCELLNTDLPISYVGGAANITQNMPWFDGYVEGGTFPPSQSWELPATTTYTPVNPNDTITEANFQGNIAQADKTLVRKLVSGYDTDAGYQNRRQIESNQAYEVKTIQMFNNNNLLYGWRKVEFLPHPNHRFLAIAYRQGFDGSACNLFAYNNYPINNRVIWDRYQTQEQLGQIVDRKFFPIHEPFTIHHLMMTYWVGHQDHVAQHRPTSADDIFELSVFLHTLNRSDSALRHRIAYAKWQPVDCDDLITGQNLLVDQAVYLQQQNSNTQRPVLSTNATCGFTVQIPINYGQSTVVPIVDIRGKGKGYTDNGHPFFVGRGNYPYSTNSYDPNWARTPVFQQINNDTIVGIDPDDGDIGYTQGQEQYLEVVFKITTPGSNLFIMNSNHAPNPPYDSDGLDIDAIKLQQPGAVLYLLGKKSLTNTRGNQ